MKLARNSWVTLVGGIWGMLLAGTVYGFGGISASLKSALGASEQQKQLVGVCGNVGLWLNVFGGMLSRSIGPQRTVIVSTALTVAGYCGMFVVLRDGGSVGAAGVAWFAVGLGCGWVYVTTLFTVSANFGERDRSYVIGVLTAVFGASSPFFAVMKEGLTANDVRDFMAFCAVACALLGSLCAACVARLSPTPAEQAWERVHSRYSAQARFGLLAVLLLVMLALVFSLCRWSSCAAARAVSGGGGGVHAVVPGRHDDGGGGALLLHPTPEEAAGDDAATKAAASARGGAKLPARADATPCGALRTPVFYLLSFVVAVVVATNVMVLNNLSTIVKDRRVAIGGAGGSGDFAIILMLTFSCFARFSVGVLMYRWGPVRWAPRFLIVAACLSVAGELALVFDVGVLLPVSAALLGLSDGVIWCSSAWLVMKTFGATHTAAIYGVVVFFVAIFSVIMSYGVETAVYASQPSRSAGDGQRECATGIHCFRTTHIIACAVNAVAIVVAGLFRKWFRGRFGAG
eukprot:g2333.t1